VLGSLFVLMFLLVPSVNTSYWMLTALTTQIVVMMYTLVFAAAIRLRYTQPDTHRPYRIPGGKPGIWLVGGVGLAGCTFGLLIGFIPPTGIKHWATPIYITAMAAGIMICSLPPFIIEKLKKPSWIIAHPDTVLVDLETGDPAQGVVPAAAPRGRFGGAASL
jgi:amino acid transporter